LVPKQLRKQLELKVSNSTKANIESNITEAKERLSLSIGKKSII
jgi:hypothetical protein